MLGDINPNITPENFNYIKRVVESNKNFRSENSRNVVRILMMLAMVKKMEEFKPRS